MTPAKEQPLRYLPPFVFFLFLCHLAFVLVSPDRMLMDPGTGWQLKTGQVLLEFHQLPSHDPFSYTVPHLPWTLYQWLFQALSGLLQSWGGIPLVSSACALALGWTLLLQMQRMMEQGTQLLCALAMVFVTWLVMTMHLQARPHVVTYLFFSFFLLLMERAYRSRSWRPLVALPFLMVLWCNMHGGFLAGLILCSIYMIGSGLDALKEKAARPVFAFFLGCLISCALASLLNPYGYGLHLSIFEYLDLQSLKYWDEYTSPFLHQSLNIRLFEGTLLLLLVLLARCRYRLSWPETGCLLFFLHHALGSVRHVILFMLVASPVVARLAGLWIGEAWPAFSARLQEITLQQKTGRAGWIYAGVFSLLFLALVWVVPGLFRQNLDDLRLSKASALYIENHRSDFGRMFNTDDLGGALIYRFGPGLPVFVDDRTDLYRDDFILNTYLPVLRMDQGWYEKLEAFGVSSAVIPADSPLGKGLEHHGWQLVHRDSMNALYLKK